MDEVEEAYAWCRRYARGHYENFPVASLLLPAAMRPHVAAVYAFARAADDFADEGVRSDSERLALLRSWRERLRASTGASAPPRPPLAGEPAHAERIFVAVGASIRRLDLPVAYFEDLLSAFEQDVTTSRYASWRDVLDYCRRSANPVGRLVLRIAGRADGQLDDWSDSICTALQLTNFWQDLGPDLVRGRLYVPRDVQQAHGVGEDELGQHMSAAWRAAMSDVVSRTREMFEAGRPLAAALDGRLRYEIRATWLGGMRILQKIEHAGYDVLASRPRLRAGDAVWIGVRLMT
jgi:squalene synthase HpnC